jgi:hypothetical protein
MTVGEGDGSNSGALVTTEYNAAFCRRWNIKTDAFYCPPGWQPILEKMLQDLSQVRDWDPRYIDQVKDKLGTLRFYYTLPLNFGHITRLVRLVVAHYCDEAARTCDVCGSTDGVKTYADKNTIVHTSCPEHRHP